MAPVKEAGATAQETKPRCHLWAHMWLWLVVAVLTCGCGEEAERETTVPSLEYEISVRSDDGSELEVSLKTKGTNEGKTEFAIDQTWGGAGAVADQVRDLRARGPSGRKPHWPRHLAAFAT